MAEREPYSSTVCMHYSSSSLPCRAGVNVANLRDDDGRIPCVVIRDVTGTVRCDLMQMPKQPAAQEPGSLSRSLASLVAGRCPTCDTPIRGEADLDDKVVAMPCRHVLRSAKAS